jgi:hypothetical protein
MIVRSLPLGVDAPYLRATELRQQQKRKPRTSGGAEGDNYEEQILFRTFSSDILFLS